MTQVAAPFTLFVAVLACFGLCGGLSLFAYALTQNRRHANGSRDTERHRELPELRSRVLSGGKTLGLTATAPLVTSPPREQPRRMTHMVPRVAA